MLIEIKESEMGFNIANLILSKEGVFTVEEIESELKNKGVDKTKEEVKFVLEKLKQDGLVIKYGFSSYRVCL